MRSISGKSEGPATALARPAAGAPPDGLEWIILATPDLNGALRGKALSAAAFWAAVEAGFTTMTDLVFATDAADAPIATSVGVGPATGSRDLLLCPDVATLTPLPWQPSWAWCLGSPSWRDGSPCDVSPRVVCARAIAKLEERGLATTAAFEYEFRLYDRHTGAPVTPGQSYSLQHLRGLAGFVDALGAAARACGLELAAFHTEAGPGLMEINLRPSRGLQAADQAILLRACISEIAQQHDMRASFLAKPKAGEEGSGGHLHVSLLNDAHANVFAGDVLAGEPVTAEMGSAIAGLLDHMPAMSIVYNPHVNSYKRLVPGWFAPVDATWAIDDRASAVRVVAGARPEGTHLELRRAGADANPYLVLAAAATSMLSGLERELSPPPPAPEGALAALPSELRTSLLAFAADDAAREGLGQLFSRHYAATREWELRAWQEVVTDWETTRAEGAISRPLIDTSPGAAR